MPTKMPMMAITVSNSTSVNPNDPRPERDCRQIAVRSEVLFIGKSSNFIEVPEQIQQHEEQVEHNLRVRRLSLRERAEQKATLFFSHGKEPSSQKGPCREKCERISFCQK
jgi:hypothetical protein